MNNKQFRFYQLSFCSKCKNRAFNIDKGIICSLTNEIATFDKNCNLYELDEVEYGKTKNNISQNIEFNYPGKSDFEALIKTSHFIKKETIFSNFYKSKEKTFNKVYKTYDYKIVIISTMSVLLLLSVLLIILTKLNYLVFLIILTFGVIMYYLETIKKEKKIIIDKDFIEVETNKIYWDEIIEFGIWKTPKEHGYIEQVLLFTINQGVIKIKAHEFEYLTSKQLIEIIKLNID